MGAPGTGGEAGGSSAVGMSGVCPARAGFPELRQVCAGRIHSSSLKTRARVQAKQNSGSEHGRKLSCDNIGKKEEILNGLLFSFQLGSIALSWCCVRSASNLSQFTFQNIISLCHEVIWVGK